LFSLPDNRIWSKVTIWGAKPHFNVQITINQYIMGEVLEQTAPTGIAKISLTDGAVKELLKIRANQPEIPADYALRVGAKGGGCSGFEYILGFDEVKDGDDVFEVNGVRVAMNKSHAIYLLGMQIDFSAGLDNRGFTFTNPNATSTCGCGTSFAA
jgi:iron-sulfur cluster assembly protein